MMLNDKSELKTRISQVVQSDGNLSTNFPSILFLPKLKFDLT